MEIDYSVESTKKLHFETSRTFARLDECVVHKCGAKVSLVHESWVSYPVSQIHNNNSQRIDNLNTGFFYDKIFIETLQASSRASTNPMLSYSFIHSAFSIDYSSSLLPPTVLRRYCDLKQNGYSSSFYGCCCCCFCSYCYKCLFDHLAAGV